VKAVFTVVGAILFLTILTIMVLLMIAIFSNYINTVQIINQYQQLSALQQQLQQGVEGWIDTSITDTNKAWINATVYNVGVLAVKLTSILVVWPNNTATPIENLTYTISFTPPTCGSSSTIDGKLAIELLPACRVDIDIRADVDSETAKYINLTRIVAIVYTFSTRLPTPIPASTILQLQYYKPTKTTLTPTPKLQLAKRHAIAWDTFDTDPFAEGKLYVLYEGMLHSDDGGRGSGSYGWANNKIWLNTTASASRESQGTTKAYYVLSIAIDTSKYNPAYPEINETIADKVFIIANVTMFNRINIVPEAFFSYGEVNTEEYLVFPNTTRPSSNYYALGGWNNTTLSTTPFVTSERTYEELVIVAVSFETPMNTRQLQRTLLTNRTVTLEAFYDSQSADNPLSVCVIIDQASRECLSSSDDYNIFPATAGFQSSTQVQASVYIGGSISAEGYTNVSVDWFVLSLNATPEYINVTGLGVGWSVELYDGGQLVASAVAGDDGVASLFVAFHPIVVEPRVVIKDSNGNLVADIRLNKVMVGGDVWVFSLG